MTGLLSIWCYSVHSVHCVHNFHTNCTQNDLNINLVDDLKTCLTNTDCLVGDLSERSLPRKADPLVSYCGLIPYFFRTGFLMGTGSDS